MEFVEIGGIIKSHGIKGKLVVGFTAPFDKVLIHLRALFIDLDGNKVPFMIEKAERVEGLTFLIELKNVKSREDAIELHGKKIWANLEEVSASGVKMKPELEENIVGFQIVCGDGTELQILDIQEYPQQIMMVCSAPERDNMLIPFVEEWITNFDAERRIIELDLPEGLI